MGELQGQTALSLDQTMSHTLDDRFQQFHKDNPHVYDKLVSMTRQLKEKGHKKVGMQMLFEVLRWNSMMRTVSHDYKLNNDYCSRYARLIMDQEQDLEGIFELRRITA